MAEHSNVTYTQHCDPVSALTVPTEKEASVLRVARHTTNLWYKHKCLEGSLGASPHIT